MTSTSSKLEQELEAIRTGAAIYPLTDRAFLRITGSDATRWLNGMVTNSIQSLAPGEGNYNFLLNAQGRIQGDCTIYREPHDGEPTYLLETDQQQIDTIQATLDKFIIMDDVELSREIDITGTGEMNSSPRGIGVLTTRASETEVTSPLGHYEGYLNTPPAPGLMLYRQQFVNNMILMPPRRSIPYVEIWTRNDADLELIRESQLKQGAIHLSDAAKEAHRILTVQPKFGQDIRDRDLPQETAQTHALHFAKGCYLGQEIVERIRSRGQVHRTFTAFTLIGQLPELPATLEANGKPAGELTSAIQIGDIIHALGYLRREAATQPLTYPGGTATPRVASKTQELNTEN